VKPTKILTLGATALSTLFDMPTASVMASRGRTYWHPDLGVNVTVTFHPAACLRSAKDFNTFAIDVEKFANCGAAPVRPYPPPPYKVYNKPAEAMKAIRRVFKQSKWVSIDCETTRLEPQFARILLVGFGGDKEIVIIPEAILAFPEIQQGIQDCLDNGKAQTVGLGSMRRCSDIYTASGGVGTSTRWLLTTSSTRIRVPTT
jgi:hypothetical protein